MQNQLAAAVAAIATNKTKRQGQQYQQISVNLPVEILAQIDARAAATNNTRAEIIKTMLAYWLALEAATTKPAPAPAPAMQARTRTVGEQAAMLAGLAGLGVNTAPAAGLAGVTLDAWIDAAEEANFQKLFQEFTAKSN